MKQLLTKDQADWLIKEVTSHFQDDAGLCVAISDVKKLINQCTEKEFPRFEMSWKDRDDIENDVSIDIEECHSGDEIVMRLKSSIDAYPYFTAPSFMRFVDGCNKIVEWLEEQE